MVENFMGTSRVIDQDKLFSYDVSFVLDWLVYLELFAKDPALPTGCEVWSLVNYITAQEAPEQLCLPRSKSKKQDKSTNIFTGKKYSKLVQFYGKAHCMCEYFYIFSPKGSFCSPSLYPPNNID